MRDFDLDHAPAYFDDGSMATSTTQSSSSLNATSNMREGSSSGLPSYSAATTDPGNNNSLAGIENAYTDFTISDLRSQILANAALLKPFFTDRKSRSEYDMELILAKDNSGRHKAVLVRSNTVQTIKEDFHHGKILVSGKPQDTPRQAFETLLLKTEKILGDMLDSSKIGYAREVQMHGQNPRRYD